MKTKQKDQRDQKKKKMKDDLANILVENKISTKNKSNSQINKEVLDALAERKKSKVVEEVVVENSESLRKRKFICECGVEVVQHGDIDESITKCSKCLK